MRELLTWNVNLGRVAGVHVRLHALFLLLAGVALFAAARGGQQMLIWWGAFLAILFACVLVQELLQCLVALRLGGEIDQIVLWPLGGLVAPRMPNRPGSEFMLACTGPLFYLTLSTIGVGLLLGQNVPLSTVFHPFVPPYDANGFTWITAVQIGVWLNFWMLLVLNLLPALPLAGGRALQSALWAVLGRSWAVALTARATQVTGIGLCIVAWWIPSLPEFEFTWVPVVFLGMLLFFSAKPDRIPQPEPMVQVDPSPLDAGDDLENYHFSPPESFEPDHVTEWLEARQEEKLRRQRELEEEEDRRMDEILARLHETGMQGLSAEDRALLDRVSERYRNRQ